MDLPPPPTEPSPRPLPAVAVAVQKEEQKEGEEQVQGDDGRELCRTPSSKESKLPSIASTCPPAPKKRRSASVGVVGRKRRLSELDDPFAVSAEEMERVFRRSDDDDQQPTASLKKRKWSSI